MLPGPAGPVRLPFGSRHSRSSHFTTQLPETTCPSTVEHTRPGSGVQQIRRSPDVLPGRLVRTVSHLDHLLTTCPEPCRGAVIVMVRLIPVVGVACPAEASAKAGRFSPRDLRYASTLLIRRPRPSYVIVATFEPISGSVSLLSPSPSLLLPSPKCESGLELLRAQASGFGFFLRLKIDAIVFAKNAPDRYT